MLDTIWGYWYIKARYNTGIQVYIGSIQYGDFGIYRLDTIHGYRYIWARYNTGIQVYIG